ncbi:tRNA lysidine(34) synthetase TilS [Christensenella tenuis]|uniref:tRNA(Ile)-lysidine synthase n=1 Tax=Christensenella tenuis TaxID=2763033 RepID=A0ABR7EGI0_9FIRM|nr:tRNA lysidine(34) synthetase TilS [Christensenella tenuis]MBC5648773.1 tRNA lysidine(34) synthetase TilS [Christensenella tenuis]
MEERVRDFITENGLIGLGQTVGAAVSGGPDSMALLACLQSLAPFFSCSVACVHFEHGIRGQESLDDADFVSRFCEENGIPFYMGAADVPALAKEWGLSEETAAKRARETYFNTLVENEDVDVIATGHHSGDNAESVLMHILRGSGIDGLKGISVRNGNFIRPLLCVSRDDVMEYVQEKSLPYVQDGTNKNAAYTRNFVRNVLLPQIRERINPDVSGALNRLSGIAGEDSAFIFGEAERIFPECAAQKDDRVKIDIERFLALSPAVAYRVVKIACAKLFVTQDIENVHIGAVMRLAKKNRTGTRANLAGGLCAEVEYGSLVIRFAARRVDYSFCSMFDIEAKNETPFGDYIECEQVEACDFSNQDPYTAYVDRDKLPAHFMFRTRYTGDRIAPLGSCGSKKLKDYFIDKKLTREEREKTPLLADGNRIIWAVGHVIGDDYKVDDTTKRILRMNYIRCGNKEEIDGGES